MSWRQGNRRSPETVDLSIMRSEQITFHNPGAVTIEELNEEGAGQVVFLTTEPSLRILPDGTNHAIKWYFENKCADGALLLKIEERIELHVVELKSKLTPGKWSSARRQLQGMLFNSLAVAGALSLPEPSEIVCYVTYYSESISQFISANPAASKQLVGSAKPVLGKFALELADFQRSGLTLADGEMVPVRLVLRDEFGNSTVDLQAA